MKLKDLLNIIWWGTKITILKLNETTEVWDNISQGFNERTNIDEKTKNLLVISLTAENDRVVIYTKE